MTRPLAVVYIPTPFRKYTGMQSRVEAAGETVQAVVDSLLTLFPDLRPLVVDERGVILGHLNIYLGEAEIRTLQGAATPVPAGSELAIIPAMAGGSGPLLTDDEMTRYSRNILLKEVGVLGQKKLKDARVLLIGAGGLGSPCALYLAAAGVGTIGLVDGDKLDLTNLQRQVLHNTHDIERPKALSGKQHLEELNPLVRVVPYQVVLSSENALEIIREYDVVVNGCDNFPTRYLVNDACVMLKKPLVDASILMWEAQAAVFVPGKGCYRCLYPAPPPPGSVPSCADAGVIGAMAGHLGTWQALETVKIILGVGEVLDDRLLLFDALGGDYRTLKRQRNPRCPVCGDHPTITTLIDYYEFCGVPGHGVAAPQEVILEPVPEETAPEWKDFPDMVVGPQDVARFLGHGGVQWVDVREQTEYNNYHIPGITLIPMSQINRRYQEIDKDRPVILVCEIGQRSGAVTQALRRVGYNRAYNLKGGMQSWINHQLPTE